MSLTYHSYLKIEKLLSLQELESPDEHDEMLFIIIHQTYELWFKEMLHELDFVCSKLEAGNILRASHNLKRTLTVLKVVVHQIDILETMTPLEFLSFRDYLKTASGFQSSQWRELEFLLGQKSEIHLQRFQHEPEIWKKLTERFHAPSLWECFIDFLRRSGHDIPRWDPASPGTIPAQSPDQVRKALREIYYTNPPVAGFCELLVDLDEGMQEWRYRHVKMVERTIGYKQGTGGSAGVDYLKTTLFKPLFPDLWEVRTDFTP